MIAIWVVGIVVMGVLHLFLSAVVRRGIDKSMLSSKVVDDEECQRNMVALESQKVELPRQFAANDHRTSDGTQQFSPEMNRER